MPPLITKFKNHKKLHEKSELDLLNKIFFDLFPRKFAKSSQKTENNFAQLQVFEFLLSKQ